MAKITITSSKGLAVIFDSGLYLSIQIGGGNYCDNYDLPIGKVPLPPSSTAELACWIQDDGSEWFKFDGDIVSNRTPVSAVFSLIAALSEFEAGFDRAHVQSAIDAAIA